MKRLFCVLFAFLLVCVVPVAAMPEIYAYDDYFNSDCGGCDVVGPFYIGNVLKNDLRTDSTTVKIIQNPKHGSAVFGYFPGEIFPGDLFYGPNEGYVGPDYLLYRLYDTETHIYSNPATVHITVERWVKGIPIRTQFFTPPDTELIVSGVKPKDPYDDNEGCFGEGTGPMWHADIMSWANHGKITFDPPIPDWEDRVSKRLSNPIYRVEGDPVGRGEGRLHYMPDAGFTGWDHFTYRCVYDTGAYGFCYSKVSEMWIYVGNEPYPSPEFPSIVLPITLIIAFVGTVLYIRSIREH